MQARIPPPIVAALVAAAMYGVSLTPLAVPFDTGVNDWIATALVLAGALVATLGIIQFQRHKTTVDPLRPDKASTLVTTGIFRVTRNPMYVGLLLILLAVGVRLGSITAVIMAFGFVPLITALQIRAEEAAMRALFGTDYQDYTARVRRWL